MPKQLGMLQVRRGVARDLDAIHAWLDAIPGHSWRSADLLQAMQEQSRLLLVAVERVTQGKRGGPQLVHGLVLAQRILDETTLLYMAVAPPSRRRGIGRLLLQQLQVEASAAGGMRIVLEARESNAAARSLYLNCGFEPVGERRDYYPALSAGPSREHAIVLAWQKPA